MTAVNYITMKYLLYPFVIIYLNFDFAQAQNDYRYDDKLQITATSMVDISSTSIRYV